MVSAALTIPDRLELLLDWINDDEWLGDGDPRRQSIEEVGYRLTRFLKSFDGSASAGHIRAEPVMEPTGPRHEQTEELTKLRFALQDQLRRGFPPSPGFEGPAWTDTVRFSSLQFGYQRVAPSPASDRDRQRWKRRPGAYVWRVSGKRSDLVQFLMMQMLRQPGGAVIERCPAPAPYNPTRRCERFFVTSGLGRPKQVCSDACRIRRFAFEAERKESGLSEVGFQELLEQRRKDEIAKAISDQKAKQKRQEKALQRRKS